MEIRIRHFIREIFYPAGVTALPWKMLCVLTMLCILNDMNITMLFSFAPKMVKEFGISEVETGFYAGWLSSVTYAGILCCTFLWSYLGDAKGKKISIIITTMGHTLGTLAFGFSYNYYWALVTRLVQGSFFGVIPVSKSILYGELDDSNMAYGMTVLTSSGVLGYIIGPGFAGFLVFPHEQYPKVFSKDSLFQKYPVLLPHIIVCTLLSIGVVLSVLYLPGGQRSNMDDCSPILKHQRKCNLPGGQRSNMEECIPMLKQFPPNSDGEGLDEKEEGTDEKSKKDKCIVQRSLDKSEETTRVATKFLNIKTIKVIVVKDCFISCILYGVYGFASIANNEIFALLASTTLEYHGMGLTTYEIGMILLLASVLLIVVQIPILRKVTDFLGARKTFIYSALLQAFFTSFIPSIGVIENKSILLPILCVHMFALRLCVSSSFLSITMLINNSISPDLNATANGLGFTLSALGRLISPSVFGALYSWSLTNVKGVSANEHPLGYPFNQYFSFYILAIVLMFIGFIGTRLSLRVDKKLSQAVEK